MLLFLISNFCLVNDFVWTIDYANLFHPVMYLIYNRWIHFASLHACSQINLDGYVIYKLTTKNLTKNKISHSKQNRKMYLVFSDEILNYVENKFLV